MSDHHQLGPSLFFFLSSFIVIILSFLIMSIVIFFGIFCFHCNHIIMAFTTLFCAAVQCSALLLQSRHAAFTLKDLAAHARAHA
jgi:hypothetical protein